jgi:hypothetical protein
MFGMSDPSKTIDYAPTEIVEFNRDLTLTGDKAVLKEGAQIGKNSLTMAMYNGKLYVGCIGGRQGPGVYGDIWEVDLGKPNVQGDMAARQVLDFENVTGVLAGAGWGTYGVDFADDGTAFILAGGYDPSMDFKGRLFKMPGAELAKGGQNALSALETKHDFINASGHSWWDGVTWDSKSQTVWCMAGTHLFAFDKEGTYKKDFDPATLGEDIYSVALLNENIPSGQGVEAAEPPAAVSEITDTNVVPVSANDVTIVKAEQGQGVADVLNAHDIDPSKAEFFQINENNGQLEINPLAIVKLMAETLPNDEFVNIDYEKIQPLGTFEANNSDINGKVAFVTLKMDFIKLANYNFDNLMLLKLKTDGKIEKLTRAKSWADMTERRYIITDENDDPQSGTVVQAKEYYVSLAIREGSEYDWSSVSDDKVTDPTEIVPIGDADYPSNRTEGGGMPGGCAAGTGGAAALAALAMILCGRKRRFFS